MAALPVAGGEHGAGAVIGAGGDDRELLLERQAVLADFLKGKLPLHAVINDDAIVSLYLENSGRVNAEEMRTYMVPDGYEIDNVWTLDKIFALMNHYQLMSVRRRRILFLKLIALLGVRGTNRKDAVILETAVLKEYEHDKDELFDLYRGVKHVRASFIRVPDVFRNDPEIISKK